MEVTDYTSDLDFKHKAEEVQGVKNIELDSKLDIVIDTITSNINYESLYVFGSYARGQQSARSDLDLLVLVRLPILISSLPKIRRLFGLRKYGVDLNVISTYSLREIKNGGPSPITPFLVNWRTDSVLVAGKDSLPVPIPAVDSKSFALFACRVCRWVLGFMNCDRKGITLAQDGQRWLVKQGNNMIENCKLHGVPRWWGTMGERVKNEASKPNPNLKFICSCFADILESIRNYLKFTSIDKMIYVLTMFGISHRIYGRTLFSRMSVQERFLDSLLLLFRSASMSEPDVGAVNQALELLSDHAPFVRQEDPYESWKKAQKVLLQHFDVALRLPFGKVVFNKGPLYPRIIFF